MELMINFILLFVVMCIIAATIIVCGYFVRGYHEYESQADYEDKREPEFEFNKEENKYMKIMKQGYEYLTYLLLYKLNVENLYMISPNFEVSKIDIHNDIYKQLSDYFDKAYKNGEPDILQGDKMYFYRFMIYSSYDDDGLNIELLLYMANKDDTFSIDLIELDFMNPIEFLEFEKSHIEDPSYEGERKIMAQYRELEKYYQDYI